MGTLANIEYVSGSFPEQMVYDIKHGENSILATPGYFAAALLEPAGIERGVGGVPGVVDVPDDAEVICPFVVYGRNSSHSDTGGTLGSVDRPVTYECWTQVPGRLGRLVVHPRLREVNMHIEVEIYEVLPVRGFVDRTAERPGSRRRCDLSSDGKLVLDGAVANAADRISLQLMPAEPTMLRSTDFLVLMREIR